MKALRLFLASLLGTAPIHATSIVYEGGSGPGQGKHIVFLASDHEYRSEETCPALARILAKRFALKSSQAVGITFCFAVEDIACKSIDHPLYNFLLTVHSAPL